MLIACGAEAVAPETCTDATIDAHAELSFIDTAGALVTDFEGTATPEDEAARAFQCPGDDECLEGGVIVWTETSSVAVEVATPGGELAASVTVPLVYASSYCGDDGHCAIQCALAAEIVTLSPP